MAWTSQAWVQRWQNKGSEGQVRKERGTRRGGGQLLAVRAAQLNPQGAGGRPRKQKSTANIQCR